MQLKTLTLVAASLAVASANYNGTWGDETKAPVLESTTAPVEKTTTTSDKPAWTKPVDGGETDVADTTAASSSTVAYWGDESSLPVEGGKTSTTTPVAITSTTSDKPTWTKPVEGGETDVADSTASSTTTVAYWGDESSLPVEGGETSTTTPAASTITSTWGDFSIPVTETESTTVEEVVSTITKPDGGIQTTTIQSTKTLTKTIYLTPTGGAAPPASTPVSGGEGAPPAGGPPAGGQCGVVTQTVTQTQTVTVPAGGSKPTGPPAPPPAPTTPSVETATPAKVWQDQPTGFQTSAAPAPSAPAQGGYMGIVAEWRSKMGLPALELDTKLQNNAQDAANSSGGQLKHKLNSGSMAQVLAPGSMDEFEKIFVGGWLCELPNTPGLGSSVCNEMSKGWNYAGQTGHAEILTSTKYTKIGCAAGDGICSCDLA